MKFKTDWNHIQEWQQDKIQCNNIIENKKRKPYKYQVGDQVLLTNSRTNPAKIDPPRMGPALCWEHQAWTFLSASAFNWLIAKGCFRRIVSLVHILHQLLVSRSNLLQLVQNFQDLWWAILQLQSLIRFGSYARNSFSIASPMLNTTTSQLEVIADTYYLGRCGPYKYDTKTATFVN